MPSLLSPMLPSVGGFAIFSNGYFCLCCCFIDVQSTRFLCFFGVFLFYFLTYFVAICIYNFLYFFRAPNKGSFQGVWVHPHVVVATFFHGRQLL